MKAISTAGFGRIYRETCEAIRADDRRYVWGSGRLRERGGFAGEALDNAAAVYGLTRAPGEGDELLRARMAIAGRKNPISVGFPEPRPIHVTSRIIYPDDPNERSTMPTQNPYERRSPDPNRRVTRVAGHAHDLTEAALGSVPRTAEAADGRAFDRADEIDHPGLTLRDIDELVRLKVRKARRDGDDAAYLREQERTREAQRQAFDLGRVAGLEEQHARVGGGLGSRVHLLHDTAGGWLEKAEGDLRKVSRADLLEFARQVRDETENIIGTFNNNLAPSPATEPF